MAITNKSRKLAEFSIQNGKIQIEVIEYALNKLSKKELKRFLFYLRQNIKKISVYIKSADLLSNENKDKLQAIYEGKVLEFEVNKKLLGGLYVQNNDDIYDGTINGIIKRTIQKLKN